MPARHPGAQEAEAGGSPSGPGQAGLHGEALAKKHTLRMDRQMSLGICPHHARRPYSWGGGKVAGGQVGRDTAVAPARQEAEAGRSRVEGSPGRLPRERLSEEKQRKSPGSQVGLCPPPGEAPSVQDKSKCPSPSSAGG